MKPIKQTRFGGVNGNCFQASVASLFELGLSEVVDFVNEYKRDEEAWFRAFVHWLGKRGMSAVMITISQEELQRGNYEGCYLLVGGRNEEGIMHSVIYKDGKIVHNPNPRTKEFHPKDMILIFTKNPAPCGHRELPK